MGLAILWLVSLLLIYKGPALWDRFMGPGTKCKYGHKSAGDCLQLRCSRGGTATEVKSGEPRAVKFPRAERRTKPKRTQ
jgi:hypothetical protein